ncbi:MAG: hypothetical protein PVF43_04920, partial [Candidatus Eiseniibacteriota bacterium]
AVVVCPVALAQSAEAEAQETDAATTAAGEAAATGAAADTSGAAADTSGAAADTSGVDCSHHVDCDEVTDPALHRRSGKSYWGIGKKKQPPDWEVLEKCETQFELAYCGMADNWEVNMFLGMVKAEFEKFECVARYFDQALALTDDDGDLEKIRDNRGHYWVEQYNEALNLFNEGAFALAADYAENAILIDPHDCRGYGMLGSCYANDAKYEEAIYELEKGLEICPEKDTILENLFISYYKRGEQVLNQGSGEEDAREAVSFFQKADALRDDDVNNLYYYQIALLRLVEYGDSTVVDTARHVIRRFGDLAESRDDRLTVQWNLATLESEVGNNEAAEAAAREYIALKPDDPLGYQILSRILIDLGKAGEAESCIIMTYCLNADPVADVAAWCQEAPDTFGAASDLAKTIGSTGCPDEARIHTDSTGNQMAVMIYADAGKAFAYYAGEQKGEYPFSRDQSEQ